MMYYRLYFSRKATNLNVSIKGIKNCFCKGIEKLKKNQNKFIKNKDVIFSLILT